MSADDDLGRAGRVVAVVAVLALALAVVVALAPELVPLPPAVLELLGALPAAVVLSLLVLVALVLLFLRSRASRSTTIEPLLPRSEPTGRAPRFGGRFDGDLAAATDLEATRERRLDEREGVEETVRTAAVDAYAIEHGVDHEAAREAVATGAWTDDLRASALVGGPEAPTPSWGQWLVDLLRGESAYHRRVRHALAETERLLVDDPNGEAEDSDTGVDGESAPTEGAADGGAAA